MDAATTVGDATGWALTGQMARVALFGAVLALLPLALVGLRQRGGGAAAWWRALTWTTLLLTFDLVLVGSVTRLTDSGLGCPDWPGCYGSLTPLGARHHIDAAQAAVPSGPVSHGKAWMEMLHRYLATVVGVLIVVMAASSALLRRRGLAAGSPGWALATLVWVCVQGAFGALTVTMKLYPAVVTLHLLLGLGLLALLTAQAQAPSPRPVVLPRPLLAAVVGVLGLSVVQMALGGWVSTNYAVLACREFPQCQGQWWPPADFGAGFALNRALGQTADGGWLPFAALTAIHLAHRLFAGVVLVALAALAWRLRRTGDPVCRRFAFGLAAVAAWQLATGVSNVVLGWPIAAAIGHSGGAAVLVVLLTSLWARAAKAAAVVPQPVGMSPRAGGPIRWARPRP